MRALKSLKIVKPIIQKVNQISKRFSAMFTLVTGSFELHNKISNGPYLEHNINVHCENLIAFKTNKSSLLQRKSICMFIHNTQNRLCYIYLI